MLEDVIICNHIKLFTLAHCHMVSAGQWLTKCCMKKCLEFENNAVSHMTFVGQPTGQPGIPYMYD